MKFIGLATMAVMAVLVQGEGKPVSHQCFIKPIDISNTINLSIFSPPHRSGLLILAEYTTPVTTVTAVEETTAPLVTSTVYTTIESTISQLCRHRDQLPGRLNQRPDSDVRRLDHGLPAHGRALCCTDRPCGLLFAPVVSSTAGAVAGSSVYSAPITVASPSSPASSVAAPESTSEVMLSSAAPSAPSTVVLGTTSPTSAEASAVYGQGSSSVTPSAPAATLAAPSSPSTVVLGTTSPTSAEASAVYGQGSSSVTPSAPAATSAAPSSVYSPAASSVASPVAASAVLSPYGSVVEAALATESSATVSASSVALPATPQTYGQMSAEASPLATSSSSAEVSPVAGSSLSLGSSPSSTLFETVTLSHTYTRTKSHFHTHSGSPLASSVAGGVATSAGYVKPSAQANSSIAGPVSFLGAGSIVQVTLSTLSLAVLCMVAII